MKKLFCRHDYICIGEAIDSQWLLMRCTKCRRTHVIHTSLGMILKDTHIFRLADKWKADNTIIDILEERQ